jgi:tetratricopeptide (TPR) repeat protein
VLLLLQLLDVPVELAPLAALSPEQRKARTFALLRHLLRHASQQQPLTLAVENLHWSDPTSEEWLTSLVEQLGDMPVLLLTTYRPGYQPPWLRHSAAHQMALSRLSPRDSLLMLQSIPQAAQLPALLHQAIVAKAAGNPFFVEELTWTTVGHGNPVGPLPLPDTIEAVLAARLDRLPPETKRLVQIAAVIGPEVPVPLLQTIAELSEEALQRALAYLQATEFLYETRLFPEPVYTFKHALTHEVAYGSLLQEQRRVLHACIVEALEALAGDHIAEGGSGRSPDQVERLAHHALRGEVWDKAVTYCQQAGVEADDRAAFREALAHFEQALQALAHLPENDDTRALAIDLRLALDRPLNPLGEYKRCLVLLREAEALARALDDQGRLGWVLTYMTSICRMMGDYEGAIAAGRQALTLAATLGESILEVQASYRLGEVHYTIGDFGWSAELLRRSVEAMDRESDMPHTDLRIRVWAWLARTLGALGAFAEGRLYGEKALHLATLEGRGYIPILAHACLGTLYLAKGDLEDAIQVLAQGLALCRASNNQSGWLQLILGCLGAAYTLQGRLREGHALLEEGISTSIRTGVQTSHAYRVVWLSEVCRLAGHGKEAWQHARQALDLARQQKVRGDEAHALHQLGVVQAHAEPPDTVQAKAYYQQALVLANELGMRPLQAHCYRDLGTLYATTGRREQARAILSTAISLYRSMEMTFWLPQVEATLTQVG